MASDLRQHDPGAGVLIDATKALVDECQRQSENCAYTATTFTIWLRWLRGFRIGCTVAPVVGGAVATWKIVAQNAPALAAVAAFLTTVVPVAYRASKTSAAIEEYTTMAGEFTNLRDRFRQAGLIASHKPFAEFEAEVKPLMNRLEKARSRVLTPPEWCFRWARHKHKAGHYQHDYDQREGQA